MNVSHLPFMFCFFPLCCQYICWVSSVVNCGSLKIHNCKVMLKANITGLPSLEYVKAH